MSTKLTQNPPSQQPANGIPKESFIGSDTGGKAICWFVGLVFAGVLGAATSGDKIVSLFHMTGR